MLENEYGAKCPKCGTPEHIGCKCMNEDGVSIDQNKSLEDQETMSSDSELELPVGLTSNLRFSIQDNIDKRTRDKKIPGFLEKSALQSIEKDAETVGNYLEQKLQTPVTRELLDTKLKSLPESSDLHQAIGVYIYFLDMKEALLDLFLAHGKVIEDMKRSSDTHGDGDKLEELEEDYLYMVGILKEVGWWEEKMGGIGQE